MKINRLFIHDTVDIRIRLQLTISAISYYYVKHANDQVIIIIRYLKQIQI